MTARPLPVDLSEALVPPGLTLISWGDAPGRLRLRFLRLCRERLEQADALFVIPSGSVERWGEVDVTVGNAVNADGYELHILLAVDAERANRLLGGFCLEYSPATALGVLTGLLTNDAEGPARYALEARLLREATAFAHRRAESTCQDPDPPESERRQRPCTAPAAAYCPLVAVFACLPDPLGAKHGWQALSRLHERGVRTLQVERTLGLVPDTTQDSRLAVRPEPDEHGRRVLLAVLPRHDYSEDVASFRADVTNYVIAHSAPPGDAAGPWTSVHPCSLRAERPALEIEQFAIALHYVSTPASLLPPRSTDPPGRGEASAVRGDRTGSVSATVNGSSPVGLSSVFDSFERDILSYAYRDTRPFQSATDPDQPPGGYAVTVRLPRELAFTSEGQRTVLACAAPTTAAGRELPVRVLRNRTVFPESGIEVFHLTLTPDADRAGFVFNEYDLIKIAKLCEGGEGFQAELIEFHSVRSTGFGDPCPPADHDQGCRFVEHHDFFHQECLGSFSKFPHGCEDWRYCEPRSATIQIVTGRTTQAERWAEDSQQLNLLADDRAGALKYLREKMLQRADESFPSSVDRLVALGGILQSLLDFERIDFWELGDVLEPIDYSEGYLLYLHKGVLLTVAESDRAAEVESNRAYVGINPYLLGAHTVLLHNEQVLRLARSEVRTLVTGAPTDERDDHTLARLRRAYRYLDDALFSDFLPNVFHYPTERTIYDEGHNELGLQVERETLARHFERVGRTVEAADAKIVGSAQVRLAIVALFVGLFAAWQVVQPIADYGQQALVTLTSSTGAGREVARIKPVFVPADAAPGEAAAPPSDEAAVATPSTELRVESVQKFELIPLLLFGVVSILCTLLVWPILRRR